MAQVVAIANDAALENSTQPADSLVTISEESVPTGRLWRVHYGPRDYVNRRGGDLIVMVDEQAAAVSKIIRGQ